MVLWIFINIFETIHDLNDSDEKTKMMKTAHIIVSRCHFLCSVISK